MGQSLVFATNNPNKIAEIQGQLGEGYFFRSLSDIGCTDEIPETTGTIEGNAHQKACYVKDKFGQFCFSEDTGLEVQALSQAPGVDTAHYAGPQRCAEANMQKVLSELDCRRDRLARFRTIICLIDVDGEHYFEGVCNGRIATLPVGKQGFGYDPIFIPQEGDGRTFAQMTSEEKLRFSHRGRAMQKLQDYLRTRADAAHPMV